MCIQITVEIGRDYEVKSVLEVDEELLVLEDIGLRVDGLHLTQVAERERVLGDVLDAAAQLEERARLVAVVRELDDGVAALERVEQLLERFRQRQVARRIGLLARQLVELEIGRQLGGSVRCLFRFGGGRCGFFAHFGFLLAGLERGQVLVELLNLLLELGHVHAPLGVHFGLGRLVDRRHVRLDLFKRHRRLLAAL